MSERQPFYENKSATDFDEVKLGYWWKLADHVTHSDWRVHWSPAGHYLVWTQGDSNVTLLPWDPARVQVADEVIVDGARYIKRTIHAGRTVRAFALGSSATGNKADFSADLCEDKNGVKNGDAPRNGENSGKKSWFTFHKIEGLVLATGCSKGQIRCWNVLTGDLIMELRDHQQPILDLKFSPTGNLHLASCSADGRVKLWDLTDDGNMYKTLQPRGYKGVVYACGWAPDARALVMVGQMGMAVLWEISEDQITQRQTLSGHQHSVVDCAFSPDGGLLVTASLDSRAILWNPYLGLKLREYRHLYPPPSLIYASGANAAGVISATFSADGHHIATVCEDKYLRVWNISESNTPIQIVPKCDPGPSLCEYSPSGSTLASGPYNRGISFFLPVRECPSLAQLSRSRIHIILRRRTPGARLATVIEDLVKEGFLPRDLQSFVQYKTL